MNRCAIADIITAAEIITAADIIFIADVIFISDFITFAITSAFSWVGRLTLVSYVR